MSAVSPGCIFWCPIFQRNILVSTKKSIYSAAQLPLKMNERNEELDSWITNWERQCIEEVESGPDLESQIQNEKDISTQKLWLLFQNSATCVAQLYKGTPAAPRNRVRKARHRSLVGLSWREGGDFVICFYFLLFIYFVNFRSRSAAFLQ